MRVFVVGTNGEAGMLSICDVVHKEAADASKQSFEGMEVLCTLKVGGDGGNPVAVLPVDLARTTRL